MKFMSNYYFNGLNISYSIPIKVLKFLYRPKLEYNVFVSLSSETTWLNLSKTLVGQSKDFCTSGMNFLKIISDCHLPMAIYQKKL